MNLLKSIYEKFGIIPIGFIVAVCIWAVLTVPIKKEIHLKYNGIEFHKDNQENEKIIEIQINGEYTTTLPGTHDEFQGTIVIENQTFEFEDYSLIFNKEGMASLDINPFSSNPKLFGFIFVERNFENLFIQKFTEPINGVSESNDWWIAAPADDRKSAEEVATVLSKKARMKLID